MSSGPQSVSEGMAKRRSLFVCAGDVSGDIHAARLVSRLKADHPDLHVWGLGGTELEKLGAELFYHSRDFAVIGIVGVVKAAPKLTAARMHLAAEIEKRKPDTVLLVDYGGFNIALARQVRKIFPDLPIIYFISPQVWASRPWRIKDIQRTVTKMLVIFPFEEKLYLAKGVNAEFVGHPLTQRFSDVDFAGNKAAFCSKYNFDPDKPIIGIFPGSRKSEITGFMSMLLDAVARLHTERPHIQFALSQATPNIAELITQQVTKANRTELLGSVIKLTESADNIGLMSAGDILWTKSGTTTLEAAFMERPMLVYYRGDWLSFLLFLLFKRVKYVAWPNLLAGKMLVPELIQLDCRAEQLVRYTRDWLDVPAARADVSYELRQIKAYLNKSDCAANAAMQVEKVLIAGRNHTRDKAIESAT